MSSPLWRRAGAVLGWLWRALDFTRRALLNLLLLAIVAALAWGLLRGTPALQEKTALVVAPKGPIREQYAGSLRDNALRELRGQGAAQVRLRDLVGAIDAAAKDPAIVRAVLVLDDLAGAGLPTLREVAAAIDRFKAAGKEVVAWGSGYDQRQYYLAAHASEIWMHPMGAVQLQGFGGWRGYYKDALDKIGVSAHVLRAGQYKNAGESFVANGPSPQTREADGVLLNGMWQSYTRGVEQARHLAPGSVAQAIDALPGRLATAGGDMARLALAEHWVDALKTRDEMRKALADRGAKDGPTFRQIPFEAYAARQKPARGGNAVAVVVAEGGIVDGQAAGGAIGGLSTGELIRRAREDEQVKALVLRVDSPGGSAFGAELVRRELELTRAAGKPVVVSMGDLAASGGYWISLAADEVIADEATVTGSIGVVALLPSAERGLDKLGIHTGGVTTSWLAGAYDPRHGLDPRFERVLQASIDHVYADFTAKAAAARRTSREKIDAVAQGRVWTGAQALERGLVDRNGSFADALQAAAARAKLPAGYRVLWVEAEPGRTERLLGLLGARVAAALGPIGEAGNGWLSSPADALRAAAPDLEAFTATLSSARPFGALVHCLCTAP